MIRPSDIPADLAATMAVVMSAKLDAYKAEYRSMVMAKLTEVRDGYAEHSAEYGALNKVLLRLGAAPREPAQAQAGSDAPRARSAA